MGGYFIINGLEKVIRMLIMPRRNFPLAMTRPKWKNRGPAFTEYGKLSSFLQHPARNYLRAKRSDHLELTCVSLVYCSSCMMLIFLLHNSASVRLVLALWELSDLPMLSKATVLQYMEPFVTWKVTSVEVSVNY